MVIDQQWVNVIFSITASVGVIGLVFAYIALKIKKREP